MGGKRKNSEKPGGGEEGFTWREDYSFNYFAISITEPMLISEFKGRKILWELL